MFLATNSGMLMKAYDGNEKNKKKPEHFPAKMPNALAGIALHQFKLISRFNRHRIFTANLYAEKFKDLKNISTPHMTPGSKNIFLWYTIQIENRSDVIKRAKKEHIFLGDWFPRAIGPIEADLGKSGYETGSCPVADKVSSNCVNLPTNYRISKKDVEKVAELFR